MNNPNFRNMICNWRFWYIYVSVYRRETTISNLKCWGLPDDLLSIWRPPSPPLARLSAVLPPARFQRVQRLREGSQPSEVIREEEASHCCYQCQWLDLGENWQEAILCTHQYQFFKCYSSSLIKVWGGRMWMDVIVFISIVGQQYPWQANITGEHHHF